MHKTGLIMLAVGICVTKPLSVYAIEGLPQAPSPDQLQQQCEQISGAIDFSKKDIDALKPPQPVEGKEQLFSEKKDKDGFACKIAGHEVDMSDKSAKYFFTSVTLITLTAMLTGSGKNMLNAFVSCFYKPSW